MTHDHHDSHAKPGSSTERRFEAEPTSLANLQALIGGLGSAAMGAATYAWMHEITMSVASPLFVGGLCGIVVAMLMGGTDANPIRVGDAGVAVERGGGQPERIYWFEVESVTLAGQRLVVEGAKKRIVAATDHHAGAAGWIVKEALARIPERVKIPVDHQSALLAGTDDHGKTVHIEGMQMAGRRCKASNAIISFERDARACKRCGEVYEKKHVPEKCLTCGAPMGTTASAEAHAEAHA